MTDAAVALRPNAGAIMENVLIQGDLSKLTSQQRADYYLKVCESLGLNPLTKPFEYILLNGKLTLYALRTCTEQLRRIRGVSVEEMTEGEREGVFIVTVKVRDKEGRTDISKGAVPLANLKGEALANAMMKAETKAKRRATLSICGLGFLDETEIDSIPATARQPGPPVELPSETPPPKSPAKSDEELAREAFSKIQRDYKACANEVELNAVNKNTSEDLALIAKVSQTARDKLMALEEAIRMDFRASAAPQQEETPI